MALLVIPIPPGVPSSRRRVHLDGVEYTLDVRWSQLEERWYLDLLAANGAPLALALKLALAQPLLAPLRVSVDGLPVGELWLLDPRPVPAPPTLLELGDVIQLTYAEAA